MASEVRQAVQHGARHFHAVAGAPRCRETRLAKRIGTKKATVAVARELSVILHRMLRDGSEFR